MKLSTLVLAFGMMIGSVFAIGATGCSAAPVDSATDALAQVAQVADEAVSFHGGGGHASVGRGGHFGGFHGGGYRGLGGRYYARSHYGYGRGWGYGRGYGYGRGWGYGPAYYGRGWNYGYRGLRGVRGWRR